MSTLWTTKGIVHSTSLSNITGPSVTSWHCIPSSLAWWRLVLIQTWRTSRRKPLLIKVQQGCLKYSLKLKWSWVSSAWLPEQYGSITSATKTRSPELWKNLWSFTRQHKIFCGGAIPGWHQLQTAEYIMCTWSCFSLFFWFWVPLDSVCSLNSHADLGQGEKPHHFLVVKSDVWDFGHFFWLKECFVISCFCKQNEKNPNVACAECFLSDNTSPLMICSQVL